jgi:hypothetical protein
MAAVDARCSQGGWLKIEESPARTGPGGLVAGRFGPARVLKARRGGRTILAVDVLSGAEVVVKISERTGDDHDAAAHEACVLLGLDGRRSCPHRAATWPSRALPAAARRSPSRCRPRPASRSRR